MKKHFKAVPEIFDIAVVISDATMGQLDSCWSQIFSASANQRHGGLAAASSSDRTAVVRGFTIVLHDELARVQKDAKDDNVPLPNSA